MLQNEEIINHDHSCNNAKITVVWLYQFKCGFVSLKTPRNLFGENDPGRRFGNSDVGDVVMVTM